MMRVSLAALLPIAALRRRLSHCRTLLVSIALSLASPLEAQRTYTYECVGQAKPKRGDTLVVQRDSSRADTASNCTRQLVRPVVTPPVNPPVIPVGSGEPVFGPGSVLILRDSMDQYVSKTAMATTANGFRPGEDPRNELQLTTGRGGTGKALRIAYLGGSQTGASWNTYPESKKTDDTATVVIQYYARITFSTPLPATTLGVKWLMGFHRSGNDRIQWHMHWRNPSSMCPQSVSGAPFTFWQVMDQSRYAGCQGAQPLLPRIEDVDDGQWHRFTHEYKPHSGAGKGDGFARMWIDGVKITDVSAATCGTTPVVPPGAVNNMPWCTRAVLDHLAVNDGIAFLKIGGALTTTVPPFTLDYDDLRWWIK